MLFDLSASAWIGLLVAGIVLAFVMFFTRSQADRLSFLNRIGKPIATSLTRLFHKHSLVGASPVISREQWEPHLPAAKVLEENYDAIRKEVIAASGLQKSIRGELFFQNIVKSDKWHRVYLRWYGDIKPEAVEHYPFLTKILRDHPEMSSLMVSVMKPGVVVEPHEGGYAGALRCHFGIQCPPKCILTVDGEEMGWEEGKCLVWDDTYTHAVRNEDTEDRIILFADIRRPLSRYSWLQSLSEMVGRAITDRSN